MTSLLGTAAKKALENYVPVIDSKLSQYFDTEIAKNFGFNQRQKEVAKEALLHSKEFVLRPQKHLRGSFVNYGAMLGEKQADESVWNAALGIEIIHAGLLMHDDFMDQDATRRMGSATHKYYQNKLNNNLHYGESMAVTVGDALLFIGAELISSAGNQEALRRALRGITNTAYGQAYDVTLEAFRNWTEEDVIVLHQAKTAIYTYKNPLVIGALLARIKDQRVFELLHDYSMDGGVAFQLQDDILGVFGTPEKTGKSADSDLKQGKCTLLVLKAFDRPEVKKVWGDMNASRADLDLAKKAIIDCGSLDYNRQLAKDYATKAAKTANKLRDLSLNFEAIDYIQGIAEYMVEREV